MLAEVVVVCGNGIRQGHENGVDFRVRCFSVCGNAGGMAIWNEFASRGFTHFICILKF